MALYAGPNSMYYFKLKNEEFNKLLKEHGHYIEYIISLNKYKKLAKHAILYPNFLVWVKSQSLKKSRLLVLHIKLFLVFSDSGVSWFCIFFVCYNPTPNSIQRLYFTSIFWITKHPVQIGMLQISSKFKTQVVPLPISVPLGAYLI